MENQAEMPSSQLYTILRIKRKRNEEPLDALVVESRVRRKKSRGGVGVFQYAQTVEDGVWQDEKRQKDIQDKISQLAREIALKVEQKSNSSSDAPSHTEPSHSATRLKEEPARRYTVVEYDETNSQARKHPTSPPVVLSQKDLPLKSSSDFKMYDAVPSVEIPKVPSSDDSEMEKFLPMLNDYLRIHDINPSPARDDVTTTGAIPRTTISISSDDYVWDVFYHRPATLSEWNEIANVGTLTGLPVSFGNEYDSTSESEEEDEADEDSNAEEYYKNDYPDEEDDDSDFDDSDEFHEDSEYDDMMNNGEEAEEF